MELGSLLNKFTHSLYKFGKFMSQPWISLWQFLPKSAAPLRGAQRGPGQAQPPVPTRAGHLQPAQVDFLTQICFDTCSQKSLEAREQLSMEKLIASETLQPKGNQTVTPKPIKNQNNPPPQKASVYMCVDVINIAKHICLPPLPSQ